MLKKLFSSQRGQSVVELALVLPILIFLLFGVMEMGRLFEGYMELQNAARDGARYASIHSKEFPTATVTTDQWRESNLRPRVNGDLVVLQPASLGLQLNKTSAGSDEWVEVTLTYNLKLITPLISDLIATDKANSTFGLKAKMAMRGE